MANIISVVSGNGGDGGKAEAEMLTHNKMAAVQATARTKARPAAGNGNGNGNVAQIIKNHGKTTDKTQTNTHTDTDSRLVAAFGI